MSKCQPRHILGVNFMGAGSHFPTNPEKVCSGKLWINYADRPRYMLTSDKKYMLHSPGQALNRSAKLYNLDIT